MDPDQLREALISQSHSLWGVENSERPEIFTLRTIFGHKYCFILKFKYL